MADYPVSVIHRRKSWFQIGKPNQHYKLKSDLNQSTTLSNDEAKSLTPNTSLLPHIHNKNVSFQRLNISSEDRSNTKSKSLVMLLKILNSKSNRRMRFPQLQNKARKTQIFINAKKAFKNYEKRNLREDDELCVPSFSNLLNHYHRKILPKIETKELKKLCTSNIVSSKSKCVIRITIPTIRKVN